MSTTSTTSTINAINTQTLAFLPAVIAGIQVAEAADAEAPGEAKLQAVLAGIGQGAGVLAGSANPNIAGIAQLTSLAVLIFNLLGKFKKKKPADAAPLAHD